MCDPFALCMNTPDNATSPPLIPPPRGVAVALSRRGDRTMCLPVPFPINPHAKLFARPVKTGRWRADRPPARTRCTRLQTIRDKLLSFFGIAKQSSPAEITGTLPTREGGCCLPREGIHPLRDSRINEKLMLSNLHSYPSLSKWSEPCATACRDS